MLHQLNQAISDVRTLASEGTLEIVNVLVQSELLLLAELVVADVTHKLAVN